MGTESRWETAADEDCWTCKPFHANRNNFGPILYTMFGLATGVCFLSIVLEITYSVKDLKFFVPKWGAYVVFGMSCVILIFATLLTGVYIRHNYMDPRFYRLEPTANICHYGGCL